MCASCCLQNAVVYPLRGPTSCWTARGRSCSLKLVCPSAVQGPPSSVSKAVLGQPCQQQSSHCQPLSAFASTKIVEASRSGLLLLGKCLVPWSSLLDTGFVSHLSAHLFCTETQRSLLQVCHSAICHLSRQSTHAAHRQHRQEQANHCQPLLINTCHSLQSRTSEASVCCCFFQTLLADCRTLPSTTRSKFAREQCGVSSIRPRVSPDSLHPGQLLTAVSH